LIVEHPLRPGYKLTSAVKPTETTNNAYRFELKLAPSAEEKFTVQEENLYEESTMISSLSPDMIVAFLTGRAVSDAGRRQLEQIANLKRQSADAETLARNNEAEMNELVRDQDRLRQNIGSLRNVTGQDEQVQKYSRQLAAQESQIAGLRDSVRDQRRKKQTLDKEILALIDKLDF
jgi:ABC-type Fe3+-hydroxamate transport system substrate-binding protein